MKKFNYQNEHSNYKLDKIKKYQGKLEFIEDHFPDEINKLTKYAIFEEAYYSTKIEGIILDYKHCKKIFDEIEKSIIKGKPGDINNFELQFQGYVKLLLTFNKRLNFFQIDSTSLHAMFYALFNIPAEYQNNVYRTRDYQEMVKDNNIVQVRVSPIEAYETPLYIGSAITSLEENFKESSAQNIINIAKLIVDIMCIRPFDAGCGRIARLYAYLLLLKSDVNIVKYVSLSKILESKASQFYESISLCCQGWEDGNNTYKPFIDYFIDCIIKAYDELFKKNFMPDKTIKKNEQIYIYLKNTKGEISKRQIERDNPDISLSTIENTLRKLKTDKKIKQIGGGRSTRYTLI